MGREPAHRRPVLSQERRLTVHHYAVTVYTQPACQPCRFTKRKLQDAGIAFEEKPAVNADNHRYLKSLCHQQAPVVTVHRDGVLWVHWSGLNPDMLADVIGSIREDQEAAA